MQVQTDPTVWFAICFNGPMTAGMRAGGGTLFG